MFVVYLTKRDSTLEKHQGVLGFHDSLKYQPSIVISWDPWIMKRVQLFKLHRRERGLERLSLYCTKCRAICWSIVKYLLFDVLFSVYICNQIIIIMSHCNLHFLPDLPPTKQNFFLLLLEQNIAINNFSDQRNELQI